MDWISLSTIRRKQKEEKTKPFWHRRPRRSTVASEFERELDQQVHDTLIPQTLRVHWSTMRPHLLVCRASRN